MTFVEDQQATAHAAIVAMREAAIHARALHARAELMRHMLTTARKVIDQPLDAAVDKVTGEWMAAWQLAADGYPEIATEMRAFTLACCSYARVPSEANDAAFRISADKLDAAFAGIGTSLADQMAWRSECAHGWWELVAPTPADLPGRKERAGVPKPKPGEPLWDCGCAPHCLAG